MREKKRLKEKGWFGDSKDLTEEEKEEKEEYFKKHPKLAEKLEVE